MTVLAENCSSVFILHSFRLQVGIDLVVDQESLLLAVPVGIKNSFIFCEE